MLCYGCYAATMRGQLCMTQDWRRYQTATTKVVARKDKRQAACNNSYANARTAQSVSVCNSGVVRISKLGAQRWHGSKGRCDVFWGRAAQRSGPLPSTKRSGESCYYHNPHPKKKNLLWFARIMWSCLSTVRGPCAPPPVATLLVWK